MSAKTVAWRCFHCDEVFTGHAAALHFGNSEHHQPACQIDIAEYRRMEETHRRHCEEDTDLHREIHAAHSAGNERARRAEEQGYARGLSDFQAEHTRAERAEAALLRFSKLYDHVPTREGLYDWANNPPKDALIVLLHDARAIVEGR